MTVCFSFSLCVYCLGNGALFGEMGVGCREEMLSVLSIGYLTQFALFLGTNEKMDQYAPHRLYQGSKMGNVCVCVCVLELLRDVWRASLHHSLE